MDGMGNNGLNGLGQGQNNQQTQQNAYGQTGQQYGQSSQQYGQTAQNSQQTFDNTQYGQNGQGFNQYSQQPNSFDQAAVMGAGLIGVNAPDYMLWLILGIVQICTICCCNCTALITGIITVVLVVMANNAYKQGNGVDYQSKMKVAKIVCCIGYGLMIIGWIVSFFSGLAQSMFELFS